MACVRAVYLKIEDYIELWALLAVGQARGLYPDRSEDSRRASAIFAEKVNIDFEVIDLGDLR